MGHHRHDCDKGKNCKCPTGPTGPTGAMGATGFGVTGPVGPTGAKGMSQKTGGSIVYQPGAPATIAPVYKTWAEIENVVNSLEGCCELLFDMTGSGYPLSVPATANLDGKGRLQIRGVGPNGEAAFAIEDGGQIKNVMSWHDIVVRGKSNIKAPVLYDIPGMIVECFDATFTFNEVCSQPVLQVADTVAQYISFFFEVSSELRNNHNPGHAVIDSGASNELFVSIGALFFASPFNGTISGPASATLNVQTDGSVPPATAAEFPLFLGTFVGALIDDAANISYTPANPVDWNGTPPKTIKEALDRIAAKITPIP